MKTQFRDEMFSSGYPRLPYLPDSIFGLCEKFRKNPGNNAATARLICASDIGSQIKKSDHPIISVSSVMPLPEYLPPKQILTREQIFVLLGQPQLKSAWTYHWYCGEDKNLYNRVGILSVTFDQQENTKCVSYNTKPPSDWSKFAK